MRFKCLLPFTVYICLLKDMWLKKWVQAFWIAAPIVREMSFLDSLNSFGWNLVVKMSHAFQRELSLFIWSVISRHCWLSNVYEMTCLGHLWLNTSGNTAYPFIMSCLVNIWVFSSRFQKGLIFLLASASAVTRSYSLFEGWFFRNGYRDFVHT